MPEELKIALEEFARFARSLKGDEKSEAQAFLERFFRALGHEGVIVEGVIEAGATFEFRIRRKPGTAQLELVQGEEARKATGKKFADLLWPRPRPDRDEIARGRAGMPPHAWRLFLER
ncbi:MAG: hypothetical protein ABI946_00685 [Chthoniobacterales bacterium]